GELRKLPQWTAAIGVGDGGARSVDSRVEIRALEQVAPGGTLERDPSYQVLGQALLDREVPLVNTGVSEIRVERHQQERGGENLRRPYRAGHRKRIHHAGVRISEAWRGGDIHSYRIRRRGKLAVVAQPYRLVVKTAISQAQARLAVSKD